MKDRAAQVLAILLLTLGVNAKAASTLYAGTNLGPYKSADGGVTWKQVLVTFTDSVLQGVPTIRALVVDPKNPSNVYGDWPIQARIGGVQTPTGILLAVITSALRR